jgi:hypothetical protein
MRYIHAYSIRSYVKTLVLAIDVLFLLSPAPSVAASKAEIDREVKVALQNLYENNVNRLFNRGHP